MEYIIHRVNTVSDLKFIPKHLGCEIDIRSYKSNLVLNHEPYTKGDLLIDFLSNYKNGTLILNIKESGIEDDVIKKVKEFGVKKYFLLDVEYPYFFKALKKNEKNLAVRISKYESFENLLNIINHVNWVWIDTYKGNPIKKEMVPVLEKLNTCLVCPSRWDSPNEIKNYIKFFKKNNYFPQAIMTDLKHLKHWATN